MVEVVAASVISAVLSGVFLGWHLRGRMVTSSAVDADHRTQHANDIAAILEVLKLQDARIEGLRGMLSSSQPVGELGKVLDEFRQRFGIAGESKDGESNRPVSQGHGL